MPGSANPLAYLQPGSGPPTPLELEHLRMDRLRELRAVIDTLRCERDSGDPLFAWAIEPGKVSSSPKA